jgi:hypothetical protein
VIIDPVVTIAMRVGDVEVPQKAKRLSPLLDKAKDPVVLTTVPPAEEVQGEPEVKVTVVPAVTPPTGTVQVMTPSLVAKAEPVQALSVKAMTKPAARFFKGTNAKVSGVLLPFINTKAMFPGLKSPQALAV